MQDYDDEITDIKYDRKSEMGKKAWKGINPFLETGQVNTSLPAQDSNSLHDSLQDEERRWHRNIVV